LGNKKGATGGPRLLVDKLSLYFQNIKLEGFNRKGFELYFSNAFIDLSAIV